MTAPTPLNPALAAPHWLRHGSAKPHYVDWVPSRAGLDEGYWKFLWGEILLPSMAEAAGWSYVMPVPTVEEIEGMRAEIATYVSYFAECDRERETLVARIAALEQERDAAVAMLGEGEGL